MTNKNYFNKKKKTVEFSYNLSDLIESGKIIIIDSSKELSYGEGDLVKKDFTYENLFNVLSSTEWIIAKFKNQSNKVIEIELLEDVDKDRVLFISNDLIVYRFIYFVKHKLNGKFNKSSAIYYDEAKSITDIKSKLVKHGQFYKIKTNFLGGTKK